MILHRGDESVTLWHGDCLDVLRELADCSVDSVVTDPPYGLGFMGKEWDSGKSFVERKAAKGNTFDHVGGNHNPSNSADAARTRRSENAKFGAWCELWTAECLRVLKPGGHLLAFGGSRTWHRLAAAVEDAGFEIRDSIAWLYGSGFPKSLDVSKAIDKAAGAARDKVPATGGLHSNANLNDDGWSKVGQLAPVMDSPTPATPAAEQWQGWGTALKPAFEPVVVGRKPLAGTVAANVLAHGTGALNIDGCRVAGIVPQVTQGLSSNPSSWDHRSEPSVSQPHAAGRWPANVILDESQAAALDEQSGVSVSRSADRGAQAGVFRLDGCSTVDELRDLAERGEQTPYGRDAATTLRRFLDKSDRDNTRGHSDKGGASRFFYVAKAPKSERPRTDDGTAHPTVKPLALMRWLVRLVTPPGGTVLEPFAGSGTTVEACLLEGFHCIAIEREADYLPLIEARIARVGAATVVREPDLFDLDGVGA